MDKRLNQDSLSRAMDSAGFNQSALARELSVSRESVSKWLRGEAFPRPDKLLRLGNVLGLRFADLVIREEENAPVIAFRRMGGTKTTDHHIEHARTMGRMLRHLVPYLPFDLLAMPPVLKKPRSEYDYLREVTGQVRRDILVNPTEKIDFHHLIRHFSKLQAVVVPVLWGSKNRHENATHIYLPDSGTTWIYLNLDVNVHDFKFWMAHELGHCLAPGLHGDTGEDFADAFAGMLLFPHELAEKAYGDIIQEKGVPAKLRAISRLADEHLISPLTIYMQVNFFANSHGWKPLQLEPEIYKWSTRFNQNHPNVSDSLFGGQFPPEARTYIEETTEAFETPFFDVLGQYLRERHKGPGFVQTVMDIPLLDARGLHDELT